MKLTDISCNNCNSTTAFEHSHNLVECTSCSTTIHMDTPVFHTYKVEPLHDIMEQRAKDKALEDIHQAIHLELWLEEQSPLGVDWSTCFDVQSIKEDFTDVVRMVEVDKKRFDNYNTNHLPF